MHSTKGTDIYSFYLSSYGLNQQRINKLFGKIALTSMMRNCEDFYDAQVKLRG